MSKKSNYLAAKSRRMHPVQKCLLFLFLLAFSASSSPHFLLADSGSIATGSPEEQKFFFGVEENQIIEDFIHIAINPNESPALDSDQLEQRRKLVESERKSRAELREWREKGHNIWDPSGFPAYLDEYLLRQDGLPEGGKITKWNKPVVIGLADFADESRLALGAGHRAYAPLTIDEAKAGLFQRNTFGLNPYLVVDDQIKGLLPVLRELTGLDISYAPGDLSESVNLHIVLNEIGMRGAGATYFKWNDNVRPNPHSVFRFLRGKVTFTPNLDAQVGGFLLLNSNGAIDRSVCKIYPYHNSDLIRSLVSECLVRAMGLPIQSTYVDTALVGQWNRAHEGAPAPKLSEECKAEFGKMSEKCHASMVYFGGEGSSQASFQNAYGTLASRTDYSRLLFNLTAYDKLLLNVLYSPEIKTGFDEFQVRKVIEPVVAEALQSSEETK